MIQLTRLNNSILGVNSALIKFVEAAPDTVITLTTGEKLVVRETFEEIREKTVEYGRSLLDRSDANERGYCG
ncbi:MAG TPA: flagellar FlbD family protein [Acidisarcina sp.]